VDQQEGGVITTEGWCLSPLLGDIVKAQQIIHRIHKHSGLETGLTAGSALEYGAVLFIESLYSKPLSNI